MAKGGCGEGATPPRPRGRHPLDPEANTPPLPTTVEKATEAGGTHPTGMHSCLKKFWN